jgi:hypothetical protein
MIFQILSRKISIGAAHTEISQTLSSPEGNKKEIYKKIII